MLAALLSWTWWLLGWAVWLLGWPAGLLGWGLLAVMVLRAVLGPEAAASLYDRVLAGVNSRFVDEQEAQLGPIKADLFRPLQQGTPAAGDAPLSILEVRPPPADPHRRVTDPECPVYHPSYTCMSPQACRRLVTQTGTDDPGAVSSARRPR